MFVAYDPTSAKHKTLPLFELRDKRTNGVIVTTIEATDTTHEIASKIPWFYFVQVGEGDEMPIATTEVSTLPEGAVVIKRGGQTWLFDAPKGVGERFKVAPDAILLTTVTAPGITAFETVKTLRQLPFNGEGIRARPIETKHGWDYSIETDDGIKILYTKRGDVSAKTVRGYDLSIIGNKHRADAFTDRVITAPWPNETWYIVTKPWASLDQVPSHLRTMNGASLSLSQINALARQADAIGGDVGWATARSNFKKSHHKDGDHWVANKVAATPTAVKAQGADSEDSPPAAKFVCSECGHTQNEEADTCPECDASMEEVRKAQALFEIFKVLEPGLLATPKQGELAIYKTDGDEWRWASISSADMWDLQNERLSKKAMDFAIAYGTIIGDRGPLRHEHIPGLDGGVCDRQMRIGDLLFEAGNFFNSRVGKAMQELYQREPYNVSLGLRFREGDLDGDGVYHRAVVFERSGTKSAAVPVTAMGVFPMQMKVSEEMLKQAAEALGLELGEVQELVERATKTTGEGFKDFEALKTAVAGAREDEAVAQLATRLKADPSLQARVLKALAPDGNAGGGIAELKAVVEQQGKALADLAEVLKTQGAAGTASAVASFLNSLPRSEAAEFSVAKGQSQGGAGGGDSVTLATIQAQLNEVQKALGSAQDGTALYDMFTSQELNQPIGGGV